MAGARLRTWARERVRIRVRAWVRDERFCARWWRIGPVARYYGLLGAPHGSCRRRLCWWILFRLRRRRRRGHNLYFGCEMSGLAAELADEVRGVEGPRNQHLVLVVDHLVEDEPAPFLEAAEDLVDLGFAAAASQVQRDGHRRRHDFFARLRKAILKKCRLLNCRAPTGADD